MNEAQKNYLTDIVSLLQEKSCESDNELHEGMYEVMHKHELKPMDIFPLFYTILISKPKGPKLAGFMRTIGLERVKGLLEGAL